MRKLIAFGVTLVVLIAAALVVVDVVAAHRTESTVSANIERRFPGSHATTQISSFPFLGHLAVSGTVEKIHVHVTGVTNGPLSLTAVDVVVHQLRLSRSELLQGKVRPVGLSSATITVTISVADVLHDLGAISGLAAGTSGDVTVSPSGVTVGFGPLSFRFRYSSLVPCLGSAHIQGAEVVLACTTKTLPPALQSP